MSIKKLIHIALVMSLILLMTGCSTIDTMVGLKNDKKVASKGDDEFTIVDDDLADSESVDTITVNADSQEQGVTVYYKDANNLLIPIKLSMDKVEGVAKAAVEKMVVGCKEEKEITQSGLNGVLPEGTKILGMTIEDGLCTIDFDKTILGTKSQEEEQLMMTALTYTLTEFDTIDKVDIRVDGDKIQTLTYGYPVDVAMERQNINLVGEADGSNYVVYYRTPETEIAGFYVPFTFTAESVENPVKVVLNELFEGPPTDLPVMNEIPYGITLNDASLKGGVANIDLSMSALELSQEDYDNLNTIVSLCLEQFGAISDINYSIEGISFEEAGLNIKESDITPVFNPTK